MAPYSEDWRTIAEQASREMDPRKLAALVSQLCCAFDERDRRYREECGPATAVESPLPANPALSRSSLPNPTA
jgi:hypothetical protein